jgi:murein DD-endopeptidase MepM/ murein hydrolase activator NlpD
MAGNFITPSKIILAALVVIGVLVGCAIVAAMDTGSWIAAGKQLTGADDGQGDQALFLAPTNPPSESASGPASESSAIVPVGSSVTPTPDEPHPLPTLRNKAQDYVVQPKDTLNQIAQDHAVSVNAILKANNLDSPDYLEVGQVLLIPPPDPAQTGPDFKIIPDSELVYGPASATLDIAGFIKNQGGYLATYQEEVNGRMLSGPEIVERVAQEFSVNPRLLLAVLEYQSGWVTQLKPDEATLEYPIGVFVDWRKGLYHQLAWAADNLNRGYYLWRVNGVSVWNLVDGTAGVQHFFTQLLGQTEWEQAVSERGLFATYYAFFGYPFILAVEPLLPPDLAQPAMQLPFDPGKTWSFTGGPHGGWGSGSAWAALDFAPPGKALGCVQSNAWVVAIADGLIVRAGDGAVIQDLDGDGLEQTGWSVLYMHVEKRQRVDPGTYLRAGERIGHPSCEGGVSTGTHLHLARRYNGEWIPADQSLPFILDGWVSTGLGGEYDGVLTRNGETVEAWEGRSLINAIHR